MEDLRLEIKRSAYYIYGYELGTARILERSLAVYDYISKKYTHFGFVYDEENKILKIPSTIDIQFILDKFCSDGIVITNVTDKSNEYVSNRRTLSVTCNAVPRDRYQKESVDFLVAKDSSDSHKAHRLLTLDTGFGKTVCAIMACHKLQMPSIITSVSLSNQWVDRIQSFTNAKLGEDLIYLKTWNDLDKLMTMKHPPMAMFYVIGLDAMVAGLRRDSDMLHKFYEKFGIGIQIFDEVHAHFLKILQVLVNTSVERVMFLSATPERSDKAQDALYRKIFRDNVQQYGHKTHEVSKFNVIMARYSTKPGVGDMWKIQPRRGVHSSNYFKYMFRYESRTRIIYDYITFFVSKIFRIHGYDKSKKVIIFVQSLDGIKMLKKALEGTTFPDGFKPSIGYYTGENKKDRHQELEKNVVFTTIANNMGLDVKGLIMVINFIPLSSDQLLKQIRGRVRDPEGWYVDMCDEGFDGIVRQRDKRLVNHIKNTRSLVYYEYVNGKIIKANA